MQNLDIVPSTLDLLGLEAVLAEDNEKSYKLKLAVEELEAKSKMNMIIFYRLSAIIKFINHKCPSCCRCPNCAITM